MIGREITIGGRRGRVTAWEPCSASLCDTRVEFPDGSVCWFGSSNLRPLESDPSLPSRHEATLEAIRSLEAIRDKLIAEWGRPWPGVDHGKAIVGRSIDGALATLRAERAP